MKRTFKISACLTLIAYSGCATNSAIQAGRAPASELESAYTMIFDRSTTESHFIVIKSESAGAMELYTCVSSAMAEQVASGKTTVEKFVTDSCKRELRLANELEIGAFKQKITDLQASAETNVEIAGKSIPEKMALGGILIIPGLTFGVLQGLANGAAKAEYFASGGRSGSTEGASILRNKGLGFLVLAATLVGGYFIYSSVTNPVNGEAGKDLKVFSTTVDALVAKGNPKAKDKVKVGILNLFKLFRAMGYKDWGLMPKQ